MILGMWDWSDSGDMGLEGVLVCVIGEIGCVIGVILDV